MQTSRDNPSVNETLIILSLVALLSSALSGLVGLGGGTILIAALFAAGLTPLEAVPLFAAVQLVSNSTRTVAYVRHVDWRAVAWFCATVIPATFVVAPFAASVDVDAVRLLLAGLILASLLPGRGGEAPLPRRPSFLLAGLLNGGHRNIGRDAGAGSWFAHCCLGTCRCQCLCATAPAVGDVCGRDRRHMDRQEPQWTTERRTVHGSVQGNSGGTVHQTDF